MEESDTVFQVKEKIQQEKKEEEEKYAPDKLKLVALGKVMEDGKNLSEYEIKEGNFLVLMIAKPKKGKKPAPAPAPAPAPVSDPAPA